MKGISPNHRHHQDAPEKGILVALGQPTDIAWTHTRTRTRCGLEASATEPSPCQGQADSSHQLGAEDLGAQWQGSRGAPAVQVRTWVG